MTELKISTLQSPDNTHYTGTEELWANERYLPIYNADIVAKLSASTSVKAANVLEFGAGIGTLAQLWYARTGLRPDCIELDNHQAAIISERGFPCFSSLLDTPHTYDIILYIKRFRAHRR